MSVYEFSHKNIRGEEVSLKEFEGKPLIIVNTASNCGFTPQYEGLQELYEKHKGKFEILAFPCNQFGAQEPGSESEIAEFCDLNFKVSFPLFSKLEVNGEGTHPLYDYLKTERPGLLGSKKIKWNFTKFLVDASGKPIKRYAPQVKPSEIEKDLIDLFSES